MGTEDEMTFPTKLSRSEAEEFLYREVRLIDEDRLEEWLTLFSPDSIYWIPSDENTDPDMETSIIHDDLLQLEKRIFQLRNRHLAQEPRSRTIHFISNVEVQAGESPQRADIRCNMIVYEIRPGDHQKLQSGLGEIRSFASRCHYKLRHQHDSWHIIHRQINLINRDLPLENITFIL